MKRDWGPRPTNGRPSKGRRANWVRLTAYAVCYALLAGVLAFGVYRGNYLLRHHPKLAIREIVIEKASRESCEALEKKLEWVIGRNIFGLDLRQVRDRVEQHPWVQRAVIQTQLPGTLRIVVHEKQASGLALLDGRVFPVDREGEAIGETLGDEAGLTVPAPTTFRDALDLPVLVGISGPANERGPAIRRGLAALETIREASPLFWDNIETFNLSDPNNMVAHLRDVKAPFYLGDEVILDNIRNYLSIARRIQNDYPSLAYIELGFPNQVAIMPK